MKTTVLAFLCLMGAVFAFYPARVVAQSGKQLVYTKAEREPEFPGGKAALGRYLAENIRIPNSLAKKNYSADSVSAKFIVDELGFIRDVRVVTKPIDKKVRKGMEAYLANVIAAIEKMPRWEPGEVGGKRVQVFYTLPIEVNATSDSKYVR